MLGLDPQQLLDLASREIQPVGQVGAPRQADLRRGINAVQVARAAVSALDGADPAQRFVLLAELLARPRR